MLRSLTISPFKVSTLAFLLVLLIAFSGAVIAEDNARLAALQTAGQSERVLLRGVKLAKGDNVRRAEALEEIRAGGLRTATDYYNAAMILQHGGSTEEIRLAHAMSALAVAMNPSDGQAKWLMAASWDRLMRRFSQPQWYGTQFSRNASGEFELWQLNPDAIDDEDRRALGVPSLEEMRLRLDGLNQAR